MDLVKLRIPDGRIVGLKGSIGYECQLEYEIEVPHESPSILLVLDVSDHSYIEVGHLSIGDESIIDVCPVSAVAFHYRCSMPIRLRAPASKGSKLKLRLSNQGVIAWQISGGVWFQEMSK